MALILRLATDADKDHLLAWRNDPETRANSRRTHELTWEELMAAPVSGVKRETYVAELEGQPVGSIRLDYEGEWCELSWTVAPLRRRRGIGLWMVQEGIRHCTAPVLMAEIKPENTASRKIAEHAGFVEIGEREGFQLWRLTSRKREE